MIGGTLNSQSLASSTFTGVSIDSRTLEKQELFVALEGEITDGHRFIDKAIRAGAAGLITNREYAQLRSHPTIPSLSVDDTHVALIEMAKQYRQQSKAKIIGITGSNGKTTTKELTYQLLKAVDPTAYRNAGNLNNLYGLPLAMLRMPSDCAVAVLEMGISIPGEMTRLADIAKPDIAAITNVGPSHLEYLDNVDGVAEAKLEIINASDANIPLILNADDETLMSHAQKKSLSHVTFAIDNDADYRPSNVATDSPGRTLVTIEKSEFRLPMFGRYQVYNLLAAYALVREAGYDLSSVDTKAIEFTTAPMRGEIIDLSGISVIADCYNANPESVMGALESLSKIKPDGKLFIVLGDMLELGSDGPFFHQEIGKRLARLKFERALLIGPLSVETARAAIEAGVDTSKLIHFDNSDDARTYLPGCVSASDVVFVKGSRGVSLEKIIDALRSHEGEA